MEQVLLDGFKANEKSRKFSVKALVKLVKLAVHPAELLNGSLCAQLAFVMKVPTGAASHLQSAALWQCWLLLSCGTQAGMQQIKSREPTEALVRVCSHRQELIDAFRSNLQSITELRSSAQVRRPFACADVLMRVAAGPLSVTAGRIFHRSTTSSPQSTKPLK